MAISSDKTLVFLNLVKQLQSLSETSPIFVVGMPRSGTTLVSALLSAHSNIAITPETHFLIRWMRDFPDVRNTESRQRFWDAFISSKAFRDFEVDQDKFIEAVEQQPPVTHLKIFTTLLKMYTAERGKRRWGEKTPGHYRYVSTLLEWYPQAKIIYVVRDPRAVTASLLKVDWSHAWVDKHAERWLDSLITAEQLQQKKLVFLVYYEHLVTTPEKTVHELCRYLGEAYEPAMLNYVQQPDSMKLLSGEAWKNNVARPITNSFIDKWQLQLTPDQIKLIEFITRTKLEQHGYLFNQLNPHSLLAKTAVWLTLYKLKITRKWHLTFPTAPS